MIPYEQLAAALERRAANNAAAAPAPHADAGLEDNTLSGAPGAENSDYEVGDILSDDEAR